MSLVPSQSVVVCQEPSAISSLLALVPDQLPEIYDWEEDLKPLAGIKKGRMQAVQAVADRRDVPWKTVYKKLQAYERHGIAGLVDRREAAQLWNSAQDVGLSQNDQELVKLWAEKWQRNTDAALRALRTAWRTQRITREMLERGLSVPQSTMPLNPLHGYPHGWSIRNLRRYAPSQYELKAARIGRSKAKSEVALTYTTRADLYVGQYYLWDDIWHDHEVVDLDQVKRGRPLEFHGLDLKSADKFAWGNRTRTESEFKHEGLKSNDFRFVLASALTTTGYHGTRGTTLIVEHGTAAIPEDIARLLFDATGGMIKVERSGMEGAAAHSGQYAGRSKGNFRFKAALESLGNLVHNELAYLPAQVGMDRDHCPEQMNDGGRLVDPNSGRALASFGLQKHTDALLAAFAQLPPERAQWLQWDMCTIQQFRLVCEEVYARINRRTEHDLEGWDEYYVPTGTGRMRRLSPHEVFSQGRRALMPISTETVALLLGTDGAAERTVRGNQIEAHDGSVSGDALRFDATGYLPDREKFLTVLNPFDPSRLFCFDSRRRLVAVLPRIQKVSRADVEAVHRANGEFAKREAALLQPLRQRHLAEGRAKGARMENNARVISEANEARDRADGLPVTKRGRKRATEADLAAICPDAAEPTADPATATVTAESVFEL